MMTVFAFTAWVGSLIDNLFLTYLLCELLIFMDDLSLFDFNVIGCLLNNAASIHFML